MSTHFPLTEVEIMVRVAAHPLVVKYRDMMNNYRSRMVESYGQDFDAPHIPSDEMDPRGHKIMTDAERAQYDKLYNDMSNIRSTVRRVMFPSK